MARMIRMTPKRALFSVRPGLPARRISQVTVTGPPDGAVTEVISPASPSSAWRAWPSSSVAVGGCPATVVVTPAGGAVVPGAPNAPVVTVGAGSDPPPVNAGTITASTITTAAPISSSPTGCRYPGGRAPLPDGGGRYPHGCRGLGGSPHGRSGAGSTGGGCG